MEKLITKSVSTLIGTVIILVASVVIFGGAFALQNYVVKNAEVKNEVLQNNETANPVLSEIEGWKTYTNTEYGFEVMYPQDWKATPYNSPGGNFSLGLGYSKDAFIGPVDISIYPNETGKTIVQHLKKMAGGVGKCATCGEDTSLTALSECFESEFANIKIGGQDALLCKKNPKPAFWSIAIFRNGYLYYIGNSEVSLNKEENVKEEAIYNKILSTFKFTNNVKPFVWEGRYEFSEFALPDENWIYDMIISSNAGKWKIQLNVDGFQTLTRINATANNVGDSLNVIFDSYGAENIYKNFNKGDVLFTLTPTSDGLMVKWNKMKPQLDKNLTESIFKKSI